MRLAGYTEQVLASEMSCLDHFHCSGVFSEENHHVPDLDMSKANVVYVRKVTERCAHSPMGMQRNKLQTIPFSSYSWKGFHTSRPHRKTPMNLSWRIISALVFVWIHTSLIVYHAVELSCCAQQSAIDWLYLGCEVCPKVMQTQLTCVGMSSGITFDHCSDEHG